MVKIYIKGNFLHYIDSSNLFFADKVENILLSKETDSSNSYSLSMQGINKLVNPIAYADIENEAGSSYASQSAFETYIYEGTGIRVTSGGTSATNLSYTASPTNGIVTSDTGTDATIPLADGTNAGLLKPADFTKLSNTSGTNTGDQDLSGLVPYTGATTDVDLGAHVLNAQAMHVKGTGGNGHLGLRKQTSTPSASANESSIYADANGNFGWKNDSLFATIFQSHTNVADRTYILQDRNGTLADDTDLALKANLASPAFTGTPTAPTQTANDNSTKIATTAYVDTAISTVGGGNIPNLLPTELRRGYRWTNNSTTANADNIGAGTSQGTAVAKTVATTNTISKQVSCSFRSSTAATNQTAGYRSTSAYSIIENGWRFQWAGAHNDQTFNSGALWCVGMTATTTLLGISSTVKVDSLLNCIFLGADALDTNCQIFHNDGAGVCTKIDLGANFPANRTSGSASTSWFTFELYNPKGSSTVYYRVRNIDNGAEATGSITTDLPSNTTLLTGQFIRSSGSNSNYVYLETEYMDINTLN